jgi:hypothetical protein
VSDAPADYIDQQLKAIVGVELEIDRLEGKWKMSQNRAAADVDGVIRGLGESEVARIKPLLDRDIATRWLFRLPRYGRRPITRTVHSSPCCLTHAALGGLMARMTRTSIAIVAFAVVTPLHAGAQNWAESYVNGLRVLDRDGQAWHQRAVELKYGWYVETSWFDANRRLIAMKFELPEFQQSNRIDYVVDTNGDGALDTGYLYTIAGGWQYWAVSDVAPFKAARDQAQVQYIAGQTTQQAEVLRLFFVRADKFYQTMSQIYLRRHNP